MGALEKQVRNLEAKEKDLQERKAAILHAPRMNARLAGYAEGVRDFRYLTAVEQRLKELRAGFDWEGWPRGEYIRERDETGAPTRNSVPDINLNDLLPQR